jgi:hypothetical protein
VLESRLLHPGIMEALALPAVAMPRAIRRGDRGLNPTPRTKAVDALTDWDKLRRVERFAKRLVPVAVLVSATGDPAMPASSGDVVASSSLELTVPATLRRYRASIVPAEAGAHVRAQRHPPAQPFTGGPSSVEALNRLSKEVWPA